MGHIVVINGVKYNISATSKSEAGGSGALALVGLGVLLMAIRRKRRWSSG